MSDRSGHGVRSAETVALIVNGEAVRCHESDSVATLLVQRGLTGKRLAVERNGAIVPRSRHAETQLQAGDRIEIVVAVGGG